MTNANPICKLSSKNLIFTPINKNFIAKFKESMNRAHKFAINSKNGLYCSLCDYDFHKILVEDQKIKFSTLFCQQMINETFDYTSVLNLQLKDYFNNLIQTLQCEADSGERKLESSLHFE